MRRLAAALLGTLLLACTGHDGRLLVVVTTDIPVPSDMVQLQARVRREGSAGASRVFPIRSASDFPLSFVVVANGQPSVSVEITVEGFGPGEFCTAPGVPAGCGPSVSRTVRSAFVPNSTRVVSIDLGNLCRGVECPGTSCPSGACTCAAGECIDIPNLIPIELPTPDSLDAASMRDGGSTDTAGLDGGTDTSSAPMDAPITDSPDASPTDTPVADAPTPPACASMMETQQFMGTTSGRFGASIALDEHGTRLLVGEPSAGRVHVFSGSPALGLEIILDPTLLGFGNVVALAGEGTGCRALVSTAAGSGRVIPYGCFGWVPGSELTGSMTGLDGFGNSIALNRDATIALVGEPGWNSSMGRVWSLSFSGGVWTPAALPDPMMANSGDSLGFAVGLDGSGMWALAGAPFQMTTGRVVPLYSSTGADLVPPSSSRAFFGSSIAVSDDGTRALVSRAGQAVEFSRIGEEPWTATGRELASSGGGAPLVALDDAGDDALVADDVMGMVRWYHRTGTDWASVRTFMETADTYGQSLSISGDGCRAAVGAPNEGGGDGTVFVYALVP